VFHPRSRYSIQVIATRRAMRSFYDILEIPETASAAWVERAFHKLRADAEKDAALSDRARDKRLSEIHLAYETLVSDAKRSAYDANLDEARARREAREPRALAKRFLLPAILIVVASVIALQLWRNHQIGVELRAQAEQDRIAAEQRAAALEADRIKRAADAQKEIEARRAEDENRARLAEQNRANEASTQSFVVDPEFVKRQAAERAEQARVQAELEERRRRIMGVAAPSEAQIRNRQELDRQARFLEQMRVEEEQARMKRAEAARKAAETPPPQ
jgi:hypothetical protein